MHKINRDRAQMLTDAVQSSGAWSLGSECGPREGARRASLAVASALLCNGCCETNPGRYSRFSPFPVKVETLLGFLSVRKSSY